jgi:hypothetical protein
MSTKNRPSGVVLSYIKDLDSQNYDGALAHLDNGVRIRGPAGETFGKPLDFIEMLRKYQGKYDVKKVFADGDDVCLFYDLKTTGPTVFMSSWYQVKKGKIVSIQTIFDPRAFGAPPKRGTSSG